MIELFVVCGFLTFILLILMFIYPIYRNVYGIGVIVFMMILLTSFESLYNSKSIGTTTSELKRTDNQVVRTYKATCSQFTYKKEICSYKLIKLEHINITLTNIPFENIEDIKSIENNILTTNKIPIVDETD